MNCTVVIDWKFTVALGAAAVGIFFVSKMDAADTKEVLIYVVNACKDYAIAFNGDC